MKTALNESLFDAMMIVRRFNGAREMRQTFCFPVTHFAAVPEGLRRNLFKEGFTAWRLRHCTPHALAAARLVARVVADYRIAQAAIQEGEAGHA